MHSRAMGLVAAVAALLLAVPAVAGEVIPVPVGGSIQAAIDAANPGDTVLVEAGTYYEAVVVNNEGITLQGMPGATIVGSGEVPTVSVAAENVTVRGLTVTGDGSGGGIAVMGPTVCLLENNVVTGNAVGIFAADVTVGLSLQGNTVTGNGSAGAIVANCPGAIVQGNLLSDNGFFNDLGAENAGLEVVGGETGMAPTYVVGNTMTGNTGAAVLAIGMEGAVISCNLMDGNGYGAYVMFGAACAVSYNLITTSDYDGIRLTDFTVGCSVTGNLVLANGTRAKADDRLVAGIRITADPNFEVPDCVDSIVTYNVAFGNAMVDARDESGAKANSVLNVWADNLLGTSRPNKLD